MHKYVQSGPGPYVTPGLTSAVCPEKHVSYRPGISCNADVTCYISSVIKCDYITPPVRMYHGEPEERKNKREREREKWKNRTKEWDREEEEEEEEERWKCIAREGTGGRGGFRGMRAGGGEEKPLLRRYVIYCHIRY